MYIWVTCLLEVIYRPGAFTALDMMDDVKIETLFFRFRKKPLSEPFFGRGQNLKDFRNRFARFFAMYM